MVFQFSLETVYRLRKSLERQEEQRLSQVSHDVARARLRLKQLDFEFAETQRQWRAELATANLAPALHFGVVCEASYSLARKAAFTELNAAIERRAEQLQRYRQARQKREILASLRAQYFEKYQLEFARRQQQQMDELYLLRNFLADVEPNLPSE
jgi:flagellar export protein FliJ